MIRRQVGTDVAALEEELVATRTPCRESRLTRIRVARPGLENGVHLIDPPLKLRRDRGGLRQQPRRERTHRGILAPAQPARDIVGHRDRPDFAALHRIQEPQPPRRPAGEERERRHLYVALELGQ